MQEQLFEPAVLELDSIPNLQDAFRKISTLDHAIFLDGSGQTHPAESVNQFSFLAANPIEIVSVSKTDTFDLQTLKATWQQHQSTRVDGLPPFQGGLAGLIGYEFNSFLENVPGPRQDEFDTPALCMGVYDVVIAVDHRQNRAWIISQGWPEQQASNRKSRAHSRLQFFHDLLLSDYNELKPSESLAIELKNLRAKRIESFNDLELYSDFSKTEFLDTVSKSVDYIRRGDVFQVNLSQRLLARSFKSSPEFYLDLRNVNPAPFSGYFDFGDGQVISASPERLVSLRDNQIETRPIKGTRPRTRFPEVDLNTQIELLSSEKDRAENIMIVDLMRNDISRVSTDDSVLVQKLCGIEEFQNVMHLVSVVQSKLADDFDPIDLLASVFPGGSITGAPKIRAMEIIAELEPTARGPYCGSLGYISFDGQMDLSILIRTITAIDGWWQIPVGGGIVADSIPELEYDETWTKAIGMLNAVRYKNQPHFTRPAHAVSNS